MLGGNDHVGRSEESVAAGGVHRESAAVRGLEVDLGAGRASDPVFLLDLDTLDVIQVVKVVDKALGILRDSEHPLAFFLADNGAAAALAHALDDLLVGEHALAARAPVDGHHIALIGKSVLEHLQEYPLRPLIILRVGGIHAAVPVEAVAEHFELVGEVLDVFLCDLRGVDMVLDSVVFRGQAEGVKADGEKYVVALHTLFSRYDVDRRKGSGVADVQSLSGGVRKLDKSVELGTALIAGNGRVGLLFFPYCLPFFLYCSKIVFHFLYLPYS